MSTAQAPFWAPHEDVVLRAMWADNRSLTAIGIVLNRSRKGVSARARKLGLPLRDTKGQEIGERPAKPAEAAPPRPAVKLRDREWSLTKLDTLQQSRQQDACRLLLVDLMREYGGGTLGKAKAEYRSRCELDIPPGAEKPTTYVRMVELSFCGSPAATCAG